MRRAVALLVLVVLAGCSGVSVDLGDTATRSTPPDVATTAPGPDNPWRSDVVTVGVVDEVGEHRNHTAHVADALAYWNTNLERYTDYSFRLALAEESADPDVRVRFVETVSACEDHVGESAGCAPVVNATHTAPDTADVRVQAGRTNTSTERVIRHELGHVLGLEHDDPPYRLMGADLNRSLPNATDRPHAWADEDITVGVNATAVGGDPAAVRRQVRHAVHYYDDGAAGTVPANLSVRYTANPTGADVFLTRAGAGRCADEDSTYVQGDDVDGDGAFEVHTGELVCLETTDTDALGWYAGYWLGTALGLDQSAMAPPFRDASREDRRSEWWR